MTKLKKENLIKTDVTKKMNVDGITKVYPVYKIKLNELYFNDQNDRIATWISKYKADNDLDKFNMENLEEYNSIISDFIKKSDEKAFTKTKNNIELINQQEPAVVLTDGRIIDGNRRYTCLRDLSKEDAKFNYLEAIIIDKDIQNSKKEIKLLELYLQHGREERVGYNPIDKLVGIYNDIVKNQLISVNEYAKNTGMLERDVVKLVKRSELMVEFLEHIEMPEHYYIAREWELDGPLGEIPAVLNKVKSEEEREQLKYIIFTYLALKPYPEMVRFVRNIKNIVDKPQFKDFLEKGIEISEKFLEKFDDEDVSLEFIKENIRTDEVLKEEVLDVYEKAQEQVKKRNVLNAPKNQVEKAIEALKNIDSNIVIGLSDEDHHQFLQALEELESEMKNFRKEVYGNASSVNE
ncbi:hypothetical protein [Staphylococcus debuckii]|uniref:hypothetical protein n=1 Tax=Staphylococcus debuckii TaxID=2044912 RepID=UPI000F42EF98|nr:hypothetical protein [Staphylococcus debuckii]AYU54308.1 hypothetical protein CNQ82_02160 [Staphylococcus debuckii]